MFHRAVKSVESGTRPFWNHNCVRNCSRLCTLIDASTGPHLLMPILMLYSAVLTVTSIRTNVAQLCEQRCCQVSRLSNLVQTCILSSTETVEKNYTITRILSKSYPVDLNYFPSTRELTLMMAHCKHSVVFIIVVGGL